MKVSVVGGGPAGLFFSILVKKTWPDCRIDLYERFNADETFGFGVVFSDSALAGLKHADLQSYDAIASHLVRWTEIAVTFKDTTQRIKGNGFCGCSRRHLLHALQQRAEGLGVSLHFARPVSDLEYLSDSDLIVAADGIASRIRTAHEAAFAPEIDVRPNRFIWLGSDRTLDAFNFIFRRSWAGLFTAHCYPYGDHASTWLIETDAQSYARAGLGQMDEAQSIVFVETLFAADLAGHRLFSNRSQWRSFPLVRNRHWVDGNIVLIGDAKASVHFSVGAGTKLALEDAITLFDCLRAHDGAVAPALAAFEASRRAPVEEARHAAAASMQWFERLSRYEDCAPLPFAFGLMTRSHAVSYETLAKRDAAFLDAVTVDFARTARRHGHPVTDETALPVDQPFRLGTLVLPNRRVALWPPQNAMATDAGLAIVDGRAGVPPSLPSASSGLRGLYIASAADLSKTTAYPCDLLAVPAEAFAAVRALWPSDRPLAVVLSAADWPDEAEAVAAARSFADRGCALVIVEAPLWSGSLAEAIRRDTGLATLTTTRADLANTMLASGKADLVALRA